MDGKRPKNQLELAFMARQEVKPPDSAEGTEPSVANLERESPWYGEELMEEVCERENLKQALKRVEQNRGSPGVDGMKTGQLRGYLKKHWPTIKGKLLKGNYKPHPVLRVEIPKPDGGVRQLGIPTVLDRFVQQSVMRVLQRKWDPTLSDHSYGFRPNRSAHEAVVAAQDFMLEGYDWVVDIDLEKFFDRVNHDRLMSHLAKRIGEKRLLKLIRRFLNAGVMEDGLVSPTEEGTPQGGPLSPLLSNIVLDELDRELERRGHRFARYADDCNIYVKSERAGHRVMASIGKFITKKLKLRVNETKSKVGRAGERKFLGFRLRRIKEEVRREVSPESEERFRNRVRELTNRNRGVSVEQMVEELNRYLRGWFGYYGFAERPWLWKRLDQWIRRRLRAMIWKQWKVPKRRADALIRRGIRRTEAIKIANSGKGPWRVSKSPPLHHALDKAYFRDTLQLHFLSA
jgi:RNA-directed DNA polymerase